MTSQAIEHARACEYRFLEGYTATLPTDQETLLENLIGPWQRAMRPTIEEPSEILALARDTSVAILVVGDPMQATTHIDLEAHCDEQSIDFSVIPGLSADLARRLPLRSSILQIRPAGDAAFRIW